MHRDPGSPRHKAQDVVARHRRAAFGELDEEVARTDHTDSAVAGTAAAPTPARRPDLAGLRARYRHRLDDDSVTTAWGRTVPRPVGVQTRLGSLKNPETASEARAWQSLQRAAFRTGALVYLRFPGLSRRPAEVVPDLVARARLRTREPVPTGAGVLGLGEDLHRRRVRNDDSAAPATIQTARSLCPTRVVGRRSRRGGILRSEMTSRGA